MFGFLKIFYALVFMANSVAILNEKRFLTRIGLPLSTEARLSLGSTRLKIVDLLRGVRTMVTIPLIFVNCVCILYELFFG